MATDRKGRTRRTKGQQGVSGVSKVNKPSESKGGVRASKRGSGSRRILGSRKKAKTASAIKPVTSSSKTLSDKPISKIDTSGLKRPGVKKVNAIKSKGIKGQELSASSDIKKNQPKFKETRRDKRAKRLSAKADKGAQSGSITKRKYNRLNKRATRAAERASGKRRTVAGTALAGAKRFFQNYGAATTGQGQLKSYKGLGKKKK